MTTGASTSSQRQIQNPPSYDQVIKDNQADLNIQFRREIWKLKGQELCFDDEINSAKGLVFAGADPNSRGGDRKNSLQVAWDSFVLMKYLVKLNTIDKKALLVDGTNIAFKCVHIPIIKAMQEGHMQNLKLLLSNGYGYHLLEGNFQRVTWKALLELNEYNRNEIYGVVQEFLKNKNLNVPFFRDKLPKFVIEAIKLEELEITPLKPTPLESVTISSKAPVSSSNEKGKPKVIPTHMVMLIQGLLKKVDCSTDLLSAAWEKPEILAELIKIKGIKLNVLLSSGESPLSKAVKSGDLKLVTKLVELGADVNGVEGEEKSLLELAWDKPKIFKFLVEKKAKLDIHFINGDTPLTKAVKAGDKERVKFLIDNQVNLDFKDMFYAHTLTDAKNLDSTEIFSMLLINGANISFKYSDGDTLLTRLIIEGKLEFIKILVAKDTSLVNTPGKDKKTPLELALDKPDILNLLLEKGANFKGCNAKKAFELVLSKILRLEIPSEKAIKENVLINKYLKSEETNAYKTQVQNLVNYYKLNEKNRTNLKRREIIEGLIKLKTDSKLVVSFIKKEGESEKFSSPLEKIPSLFSREGSVKLPIAGVIVEAVSIFATAFLAKECKGPEGLAVFSLYNFFTSVFLSLGYDKVIQVENKAVPLFRKEVIASTIIGSVITISLFAVLFVFEKLDYRPKEIGGVTIISAFALASYLSKVAYNVWHFSALCNQEGYTTVAHIAAQKGEETTCKAIIAEFPELGTQINVRGRTAESYLSR